jgi:hypothetical protein
MCGKRAMKFGRRHVNGRDFFSATLARPPSLWKIRLRKSPDI